MNERWTIASSVVTFSPELLKSETLTLAIHVGEEVAKRLRQAFQPVVDGDETHHVFAIDWSKNNADLSEEQIKVSVKNDDWTNYRILRVDVPVNIDRMLCNPIYARLLADRASGIVQSYTANNCHG